MPFGRYRGLHLAELPESYLAWLLALHDLREPLRSAVHAEQQRRRGAGRPGPMLRPCPDPALAVSVIGAGLRTLAKKTHPEVGGSHEAFIRVRKVGDWLHELVEQAQV